jgi:glycosyltransferase involved in cell wall biosynthesis
MRLAVVESASHGGLLHYAAQLADALAARGHDVDLITAKRNELLGRTGPAHMRAVLVAAMPRPSEPPSGLRYLARRSVVAVRLVQASARTIWELRRGAYDAALLVDDLDLSLAAASALLLALLPGGPTLIAVCHEPRPRNRWPGGELYASSPLLYALLRRVYARMDLVLIHGERSRAEFARTWPPVPLAVIPHGDERIVAVNAPPPADEERVLFFGDWRRAKGLHELLAAFERLARRRPAARLTIAGTPSPDGDPDRVRRWAAERSAQVEVIDRYVPLDAVPGVFARARVVAAPYLAGSQSGVVHLAMTMSRAVVASDIGELAQVVADGETGRVVPAGDVDALASALEELVSNPALAARLGAEGRRRVLAESGWERVAEHVEAALVRLPRRRRSATSE